ncbi:thiol reductant ABC exporter subunit CydD [Microbacterium sp.]|uniref:thiol reductant ABC exporter subunit CydD n=1 Tax=Microbacterium sp. TaxID=51671 RepID=UPI0025D198C1|nr:thiol reductant ABC exporter subunit CydD [Microbacterium sp.]
MAGTGETDVNAETGQAGAASSGTSVSGAASSGSGTGAASSGTPVSGPASAASGTGARRRGRTPPLDPRLLRYARAARSALVISAAIVFAQTGVIVGFAWFLARALVGAIEGERLPALVPLIGAAAGLILLRALLIVASERVSALGAARASLQLRQALVAAVRTLGPRWMSQRNAAGLAVTAGHGLEALDAYFGRYLPQLVATAITMPIVVVAILIADPVSGLIVIVTIPLIPLFMVLIGLATRAVQRRQLDTLGRLATRFADTVGGLGTLKIFGRQHRAADSIETVTRDYKRETMAVLRVSFLSGFALEFLASISVAIVAVTIGLRLLGGELGLLVGLFVLLLAPEAYLPLRQVGVQFHAAAEGVAATDGVFAVLDAAAALPAGVHDTRTAAPLEPRVPDARQRSGPSRSPSPGPSGPSARSGPSRPPILEARGLRVRYGELLLPPVDVAVGAGEIVLLEGPSGAGKSSVLAALLGFVDHEGTVIVHGRTTDAASARGVLAWAGQRPGLLAGTVRENVALGADAVDDPLVRGCLDAAQAGDIDLGRELGAGGSGLSGGQAQRVAVARALYRRRSGRAEVLALDEPSSALDAATEAALWTALRREADGGAGILLVSHRTTARTIADRIIRLDSALGAAPSAASNAASTTAPTTASTSAAEDPA